MYIYIYPFLFGFGVSVSVKTQRIYFAGAKGKERFERSDWGGRTQQILNHNREVIWHILVVKIQHVCVVCVFSLTSGMVRMEFLKDLQFRWGNVYPEFVATFHLSKPMF